MLNLTGVWAPSAFVFYPNPHESQKLKSYILWMPGRALPQAFVREREREREGEQEQGGKSHSGRQSHFTLSTVRSQTT